MVTHGDIHRHVTYKEGPAKWSLEICNCTPNRLAPPSRLWATESAPYPCLRFQVQGA